jgi:hypothetical protein
MEKRQLMGLDGQNSVAKLFLADGVLIAARGFDLIDWIDWIDHI